MSPRSSDWLERWPPWATPLHDEDAPRDLQTLGVSAFVELVMATRCRPRRRQTVTSTLAGSSSSSGRRPRRNVVRSRSRSTTCGRAPVCRFGGCPAPTNAPRRAPRHDTRRTSRSRRVRGVAATASTCSVVNGYNTSSSCIATSYVEYRWSSRRTTSPRSRSAGAGSRAESAGARARTIDEGADGEPRTAVYVVETCHHDDSRRLESTTARNTSIACCNRVTVFPSGLVSST